MLDTTTLGKLVVKFGLPSVVAAYLIWVITSNTNARLQEIRDSLLSHQIDMSYYVKSMDDLKTDSAKTYRILEQICANGASDYKERANCFQ